MFIMLSLWGLISLTTEEHAETSARSGVMKASLEPSMLEPFQAARAVVAFWLFIVVLLSLPDPLLKTTQNWSAHCSLSSSFPFRQLCLCFRKRFG